MNPPPFSRFRMTETLWKATILVLSGTVILFSVWCLSSGITTIFMHLYYFPIVLLAYRYRWKGVGLATLLALAYFGLVMVFDAGQTEVIIGAFYRVLVFVGIAAVIAYLSDRLAVETKAAQDASELREQYVSLAPAIILVLDRTGTITYLNPKGGEILECNTHEVTGKSWFDQFLPEYDRDRVRQLFSMLVAGQARPDQAFENPVLTRSGAIKIIRWHNTVLHDESGGISGILGFGEDITGEKQTQDSLRKMQQFQESVITNANVWISVLAPDGSTILVWNDAAEAISGYKKRDVVGKNTIWKQLYPDKEYRRKITGEIRRIIGKDDFLENFETEIRCADGTKKTIVWNTRGMRDAEGTVTGYIAIGRDISAQKTAEDTIRRSSEEWQTTFDAITDVVFLLDDKGRIVRHNRAFETFIKRPAGEIDGRFCYEVLHGTTCPIAECPNVRAQTSRHHESLELKIGDRWFVSAIDPIIAGNGAVSGAVHLLIDITERKQAEAAIAGSEEKYRVLFTHMSAGSALHELIYDSSRNPVDYRILDVNPAFERILGQKRELVIGKTSREAYGVDAPPYLDTYARIVASGRPEAFEVYFAPLSKHFAISAYSPGTGRFATIFEDITERKLAEKALRENEEKFRAFFTTSRDCVFITSIDGSWLDFNDAAVELFGYENREDLFRIKIPQVYANPDDRDAHIRYIRKNGFSFEYPVDLKKKDGTIINALITTTARKDASGKVIGFQGSIRDITERKRTDRLLLENQEQLTTAMDLARLAQWEFDVLSGIFTFNDRFYAMYGTTAEREGGYRMPAEVYAREFVHPDDAGIVAGEVRKAIETADPLFAAQAEHRIIRRDGAVRYIVVRHAVTKDAEGRTIKTHGANQDITDRRQTEEKLRESEQKFREIFNNINDAVQIHDLEPDGRPGRFLDVNNAACRMLGISCEELLAHNPLDYATEYHNPPMEEVTRQLRTNGNATFETGHRRADGTVVPVEINAHVTQLMGKTVVLSVIRDLTDRKKAEEEIRLSNVILKTQQETSPDGILIVDDKGKILSFNRRFRDIWGIPQEIIDSGSDERALSFVLGSLIDPREFLDRVSYLYEHRDEKSREEIRLKNGNVLERYSTPMLGAENRYFGRVWYFHDITERKQAEESLLESRQLFSDIISFLPDPTFVIDTDGKVLAWNRALEQLSGISAGDITGRGDYEYSLWQYGKRRPTLIDLVLYPDQDAGRMDYNDIGREGRTVTAQTEITRHGSKKKTSLSLVASPLIDPRGKVTGAIESMRDITHLKETEAELARINQNLEEIVRDRSQELSESERKYRTLFDKTKDAFLIIENNRFVDCNASALQMSGYATKEELFQTHPSQLSPPTQPDGRSSFEKAEEMMATAMREGSHRFEWVHRRANGEDFWVEVSLTAIPIQDHYVIHTAWRDISDRKKAEKDVQAALDYTRSVIEANPDLVAVLDTKGIILDINATGELLTGIPKERLIGKSYFGYMVDDGALYTAFSGLLQEGTIENVVRIRRTDGTVTPLSVHATVIRGTDGKEDRIIVAGHDITRQVQDEEAIQASLDEKVILLREVHHRVKNNLQIIISLVNLQMRQTDDPGVKQIMAETQNRVRAMSLVHEKLYRSESLSRIDFADYIRFLATQLFSFYGTDTRRVQLDLTMGKIMVDINTAVPLGLLMNELVSNALKHAFPNGREGAISISGGEDGDLITLVVRDNGIGIPAELDWKNTASLGMRLVTSLIDQIDGTLMLDRNDGTTFTVTVKRNPASGGAE